MIGWDKQQIKVNTAIQCKSKTQTCCFSSTNGWLCYVESIRTEEGLQSLGRGLLCRLWKSQLWQLRKVVSQRNRLWRERWSIEEPTTTTTATAIPTTVTIIIEEPGNSTLLALSRTHLGGAGKYRLSESFNQATFLVSTVMKKKYLQIDRGVGDLGNISLRGWTTSMNLFGISDIGCRRSHEQQRIRSSVAILPVVNQHNSISHHLSCSAQWSTLRNTPYTTPQFSVKGCSMCQYKSGKSTFIRLWAVRYTTGNLGGRQPCWRSTFKLVGTDEL